MLIKENKLMMYANQGEYVRFIVLDIYCYTIVRILLVIINLFLKVIEVVGILYFLTVHYPIP